MALLPDDIRERRSSEVTPDFSQERNPSSVFKFADPASGEPSDNGLTYNLHKEFRNALNRDPLTALELAKDYIFTRELDPGFRLEILRELKALQFSQPGVADLADEIIAAKPDAGLFEEALSIKYATMSEEDFSMLVSDLEAETEDPEYISLIQKHAGPKAEIILSVPLSQTAEEPSNKVPEPQAATVSG